MLLQWSKSFMLMTLEDIILKINEQVPEAENTENHKMELSVTKDGVEINEPKIAADIQNAFIGILQSSTPTECYTFIQNMLSLNHYRDSTRGLWATDMNDFINEHREKLFKLEVHDAMPGWISKGGRLSDSEDEQDDDY